MDRMDNTELLVIEYAIKEIFRIKEEKEKSNFVDKKDKAASLKL